MACVVCDGWPEVIRPGMKVQVCGVHTDRIFPQWDGRFVIHDGEVALRVFDIPWLWSQVAQAVLCDRWRSTMSVMAWELTCREHGA